MRRGALKRCSLGSGWGRLGGASWDEEGRAGALLPGERLGGEVGQRNFACCRPCLMLSCLYSAEEMVCGDSQAVGRSVLI